MNSPTSIHRPWRSLLAAALLLAILPGSVLAAPPLPALAVERQVTVSGLSSGGYMAAQFAVAYSKDVKGVGVVAGGPFDCSQGNVIAAVTRCSCTSTLACSTPTPAVLAFQSWNQATGKAALDLIDPLQALKSQRVWLFSGSEDKTVPTANVEALEMFYVDKAKANVPRQQVRFQRFRGAGHGMPVIEDANAVACDLSAFPFINNCSDDAAGDLLGWLYPGAPLATAPVAKGRLIEFDQGAYTRQLAYTGLGDTGYVYVPDACAKAGAACRLHVVFHGCRQARDSDNGAGGTVGSLFADHAGYNRWAAGSRIVVLYPQVLPRDTGNPLVGYEYNPRACWDFWGYTQLAPATGGFTTKAAPQMLAVRAMIAALQRAR